MNKIRAFIFRFFQRRQPARNVRFPHYNQVRSVLVIYESDFMEDNRVVTDTIRKRLLADDKDVAGLCIQKGYTIPHPAPEPDHGAEGS